jgi:hypothetical protein
LQEDSREERIKLPFPFAKEDTLRMEDGRLHFEEYV